MLMFGDVIIQTWLVFQNTVCDQLNSANMPATTRASVDSIKKLCLYKGSFKEKCQVLRAFALSLKMPMADIFGPEDRCCA